MEDQVIRGAEFTLSELKPLLQVELLKDTTGNLLSLIKTYGYTIFDAGPNAICVPQSDQLILSFQAFNQL
jgi:hypothetical protein